ncbi:hypothetical protein BDV25DRAFT_154466 [Aspergillus avenaceus]|uniref:Zn(2)-C6 fungal-type domain-containing protein n=1 Tax=Aspergillus avenaceus TaxID=36643 RepID=A0A5N6TVQ0_ASPAV|nr:hypothetical protein BDV25DRAFT_154466 [Aspergillus avenaceus]
MSDFSRFTGKFRARSAPGILHDGKVTKRPRASLVCDQCKRSKVRCDRTQPCSHCVRELGPHACSYGRAVSSGGDSDRQVAVENRLARLESLVKTLMHGRESMVSGGCGTLSKSSGGGEKADAAEYVGSTHWSSVLDDIQELKVALGGSIGTRDDDDSVSPKVPVLGDELIFGVSSMYSLPCIIRQYLPPKVDVDRYLSTYFRGETFMIPFIHIYQFQRQYEEFWAEPTAVSPLWLSMLFSICCLACLIRGKLGSDLGLQSDFAVRSSSLHTAAGQCLVLGEYYKPQKLAVEALTIYAQCKNLGSLEPSREAGAILGIVVRMSYEMGYHRDPDSLGALSVFEGEMRRRFWSSCKQMDVMVSFQLCLPSNISLENCDTKSPRNLLDSDFDVDTTVLPDSRPGSDATRLYWFIVKDRQIAIFGRVCQFMLSFREKTTVDLLQLDSEVRQIYETTPDNLRTRPLADSTEDEPQLIMHRIYIEFIFLKSLCVLHRRCMLRGDAYSTDSCVEAGKRLVCQFIDMYKEFAPGGLLCSERWMLTSFTMNDFLLGVMVLCLVVHTRRRRVSPTALIDATTESEVLLYLEQSYEICVEKSSASRDAGRVAHAVRLVLDDHLDVTSSSVRSEHEPDPLGGESLGVFDPFDIMGIGFGNNDWESLNF